MTARARRLVVLALAAIVQAIAPVSAQQTADATGWEKTLKTGTAELAAQILGPIRDCLEEKRPRGFLASQWEKRRVSIAIAGFDDETKLLRISEAELITRFVQDALNAAGQMTVTRLDDAARMLAIGEYANRAGARKQIDEAMKGGGVDLFLFAKDVHRDGSGAIDISLDVMTFPDRACTGTKLIRGLKLPPSFARPETILGSAARHFFREHQEPGRIIIEPSRLDGQLLVERTGRWLETTLRSAIGEAWSARAKSLGTPVPLDVRLKRDIPPTEAEDPTAWRATVQLLARARGHELAVIFSKDGRSPPGLQPEPLSASDVPHSIEVVDAILLVRALKPRIAAPAKGGKPEEIKFELKLTKDMNVYCMLDVPTKSGSYVLLPTGDPTFADPLLRARPEPHAYPKDFPYGGFPLFAEEPGRVRLQCFASRRPVDLSLRRAWWAATVPERQKAAKSKGLSESSPDFDRHLMITLEEREQLRQLFKAAGAEEASAEVEIQAP